MTTCVCPVITLSPRDYDAVLLDLDGVLTRTASVHAAAWKKLFDWFLQQRATQAGEPFVPFDIATDYPRYVDGKPRYDGVAAFLKSRGIELPIACSRTGMRREPKGVSKRPNLPAIVVPQCLHFPSSLNEYFRISYQSR